MCGSCAHHNHTHACNPYPFAQSTCQNPPPTKKGAPALVARQCIRGGCAGDLEHGAVSQGRSLRLLRSLGEGQWLLPVYLPSLCNQGTLGARITTHTVPLPVGCGLFFSVEVSHRTRRMLVTLGARITTRTVRRHFGRPHGFHHDMDSLGARITTRTVPRLSPWPSN